MNGLAKAGNGTAEFIQEGERMQPKVGYDISESGYPNLLGDHIAPCLGCMHHIP